MSIRQKKPAKCEGFRRTIIYKNDKTITFAVWDPHQKLILFY